MPLDNAIYDRLAESWWAADGLLHAMGTLLNPSRFGYFRDVLVKRLGRDPMGLSVLDVGCGGGSLAEEFAKLGCLVTGIDPSQRSIASASVHARDAGLAIRYEVARGEALPFADASFDAVVCADVLEHVENLRRVTAETARALKPGGVYLYETVNRTWLSNLVVIGLLQNWPPTRVMPPNLHAYEGLIRPRELEALPAGQGITTREVSGLWPAGRPWRIAVTALRLKLGRITHSEAARRSPMRPSRITALMYLGYGIKTHAL